MKRQREREGGRERREKGVGNRSGDVDIPDLNQFDVRPDRTDPNSELPYPFNLHFFLANYS